MKYIILFLIVVSLKAHGGNVADSTLYRNRQGKLLKYIVLPETMKSNIATINPVTLHYDLYIQPEKIDLNIEIFNVLYQDRLAVFSIMPSYNNLHPAWAKIDLDTIKDRTLTLQNLEEYINVKINNYPVKAQSLNSNLKFYTFALVIKKEDGWYCNTTDCFTEFFQLLNDSLLTTNRSYQINLVGKQLSVAEYESAYRRKHGSYSTNIKTLMGFNEDIRNGDLLYHSFTEKINGQMTYHFWLLSDWVHDGKSTKRGMDRFIFQPGVGIVSASYDFFMPDMIDYWYSYYNKKFSLRYVDKGVIMAANKGVNLPPLDPYFTEYTIPAITQPRSGVSIQR